MGDFTEHVLFGFLAAAVVSYFLKDRMLLDFVEVGASSIAVVVGAVLPDIDHKKAYVHRAAKAFSSIGAGVLVIVYMPIPVHLRFTLAAGCFLTSYIAFSKIKMKHRGFTHSIIFLVIITSASVIGSVYMFSSVLPGMAMGLGMFSHLILDQHFSLS